MNQRPETAAAENQNADPLEELTAELERTLDQDDQHRRSLLSRRVPLGSLPGGKAERGPVHVRLDRTLDDARTLAKLVGDFAQQLTGSRPPLPPQPDRRNGEGLFARIDQVATEIEMQLADCRAVIEHVRKEV